MKKNQDIERGIGLYSFREKYFLRKMTLENIIAATEKLDIPAIEIVPDQMSSLEFRRDWSPWNNRR